MVSIGATEFPLHFDVKPLDYKRLTRLIQNVNFHTWVSASYVKAGFYFSRINVMASHSE